MPESVSDLVSVPWHSQFHREDAPRLSAEAPTFEPSAFSSIATNTNKDTNVPKLDSETSANDSQATSSAAFPVQAVNAPVFVPRSVTSPKRAESMAVSYVLPF